MPTKKEIFDPCGLKKGITKITRKKEIAETKTRITVPEIEGLKSAKSAVIAN
ncbi:MAG: hypothetical protein V1494_06820 [Candidatus Diapherotrites archaeon]